MEFNEPAQEIAFRRDGNIVVIVCLTVRFSPNTTILGRETQTHPNPFPYLELSSPPFYGGAAADSAAGSQVTASSAKLVTKGA